MFFTPSVRRFTRLVNWLRSPWAMRRPTLDTKLHVLTLEDRVVPDATPLVALGVPAGESPLVRVLDAVTGNE